MRLLGKYQSSTGLVSSALSCHLCMLQLLSSDTVSQASGAGSSRDRWQALTHSTDWHRAQPGPHRAPPDTARRHRAESSGSGVEPVQQYRCTVKAYTGQPGCHGPGDDFNLSELLVLDGWAGAGWAAGTGGLVYHGANLPSEWQREPIPHPSFRAQISGPGSGSGSDGQWLGAARERIGCLLWQSEILTQDQENREPGPDTF